MKHGLSTRHIRELVSRALSEDLGTTGDITSAAIFGPRDMTVAEIRANAAGVIAGTYLLEAIFTRTNPRLRVQVLVRDGDRVKRGTVICRLRGPIRGILAGERVALNYLQRLSGVATATAALVALLRGTNATLLDTRKTTPGLRLAEKGAVVAGGGANHRIGLFDMVLIKDTHVAAAGGPAPAVRKARAAVRGRGIKVEVEVQSEREFREALAEKPDIIMLDNMPVAAMKRCVGLARRSGIPVKLEASGNVSEATIRAIARTGVDFISVGAITHSAPALDIHLVIVDGASAIR